MNWYKENNYIFIELPKIFDYELNLEYLFEDLEGILYHIKNKTIRRVIDTQHGHTLVDIDDENTHIKVTYLKGDHFDDDNLSQAIVEYVENWLDLNTDLTPFYDLGKDDKVLKKPIERFYGLRNVGFPNLFESLVNAVIGQQININFAYTLKKEFVSQFGQSINYEGKEYYIFPHPEKIATLNLDDLDGFRATGRKKEYIIGIAKLMANMELSKETLLQLDDLNQVEIELKKIKGVGPWTAQAVAMRCLKFTNALPIEDVGLINAIKKQLGMDRKPTRKEILELSNNWTGYESYATFYLWKSLYE